LVATIEAPNSFNRIFKISCFYLDYGKKEKKEDSTGTVDLALGGIKIKPGYMNGKVIPHDILNLTTNIDHTIVDRAPAARIIARTEELLESAFGLGILEE
jgi:hypothetical protein